jgi:hypothetical protein
MRRVGTVALIGFVALGLGACATAPPRAQYVKSNISKNELMETRAICRHRAEMAAIKTINNNTYASPYERNRAMNATIRAAMDRCARDHGFRKVN